MLPAKELSFENTEVAFRGKSDQQLNKAYWLFKLMRNRTITRVGSFMMKLAMQIGLPINSVIKATIFSQFCGGESIEECESTIQQLARGNVGTILDYSVEGEEDEHVFDLTAKEIIKTIKRAKGDLKIPLTVFKVTGVGRFGLLEKLNENLTLNEIEKTEAARLKARVADICKIAFETDVPVMIDAEESWIQDAIDQLALDMMKAYNNDKAIVYNTYQLYRNDKLDSLKTHLALAKDQNFILGAKLVRGAYMEKERKRAEEMAYPSPIHLTKADTDKDYNEAVRLCIQNIKHVALVAGTHNEKSCIELVNLMKMNNIPANYSNIYFSQLLGMSDNLSFNLGDAGYQVAKYVPYGPVKAVVPYLIRRAEENTSISGQTGRELRLIIKEKKRRRIN